MFKNYITFLKFWSILVVSHNSSYYLKVLCLIKLTKFLCKCHFCNFCHLQTVTVSLWCFCKYFTFREIHGKDSDTFSRKQVSDKLSDHKTELDMKLQKSYRETDGIIKLSTKDQEQALITWDYMNQQGCSHVWFFWI